MKKKIVLFLVNNSAGEVDWLLPVLNKLSKEHTVFTYFRSQSAFDSIKSITQSFNLWKKISKGHYIEKRTDNFFWKIFRKLINPIYKNNILTSKFINKKIHNLNFIKKKIFNILKIQNFEIIFVFSDFGVYSGWVEAIKDNSKRPFIVHFPSHPSVYLKKKPQKNEIIKVKKLSGDLLLLGSESDVSRFKNFINSSKIRVCGVPKFDDWWINKIISLKTDFDIKKLSNKYVVTIGIRPKFDLLKGKDFKTLENQIHGVMKVLCEFKNILIIIKTHPNPKINPPYFFKILEKYDKKKWILSKNHLVKLAKLSNCVIHSSKSSVVLDALCVNKSSIELWPVHKDEYENNAQKKLGLTISAKNIKEFEHLMKLSLNKPKHRIWEKQKKIFKGLYKYKNTSTQSVINILGEDLKKFRKVNNDR